MTEPLNDDRGRALLDATSRVALAGLLHDLGKLAERADMPVQDRELLEVNKQIYCPNPKPHPNAPGWFSHVHAAYTALALDEIEPCLPPIKGRDASPFQEWGEARAGGADDSLINAAAKHHKPDTFLQWIVTTAARAASGLDRETFDLYNEARDDDPTFRKDHYSARLVTLFEQIDLEAAPGSGRTKPAWTYRYPLRPLSPLSIFPMPAEDCEPSDRVTARTEYHALWTEFRDRLDEIPSSHRRNLALWLDHFDTLWLTYTHAVPAATAFRTTPDVSLYDLSRVVSALAAALWRYHQEQGDDRDEVRKRLSGRGDWGDPKLLFIQGDLFGIQDFIFWFLRHTFGQSGIGIAWTPATCNDLQEGSRPDSPYRRLIERLFRALEDAKLQRFGLCGESSPAPAFDGYLDRVGEHGLCAVDGRSPADCGPLDGDVGTKVSRLAHDQIRIGNLLTREDRNRMLVTRCPLKAGNVDTLDTDLFGFHIGFTGAEEASGRFGNEAASGNLLRAWDFSLPQDRETPLFHGYARREVNAWAPRFTPSPVGGSGGPKAAMKVSSEADRVLLATSASTWK